MSTYQKCIWICFSGLLFILGCALKPYQRIERVQLGMEKPEVSEIAGPPLRTIRKNDADLWTYVYYKNNEKLQTTFRLREGRVVNVETGPAFTDPEQLLIQSENYNQYKDLVEEKKAQNKSGFKNVEE